MRFSWTAALVAVALGACTPSLKDQLTDIRQSTQITERDGDTISFRGNGSKYEQRLPREVISAFVQTAGSKLAAEGYAGFRIERLGSQVQGMRVVRGHESLPGQVTISDNTIRMTVTGSKAEPLPEGFVATDRPIEAIQEYVRRNRNSG